VKSTTKSIPKAQRAPARAPHVARSFLGRIALSRAAHWLPLLAIVFAVGFNLWTLRGELRPVQNLNDSAHHLAMIGWAQHRIDTGATPLDGWFPYGGLGSPHFHHYQSTPQVITAYISQVFGAERTYVWTMYVLLALWPISVYWGARLLGWGRWASALAALASPLIASKPGYGYEFGSYTWRGLGAWSQMWGMWVLPIAWGLSWRAVARKGSYALGAVSLAAMLAFHFLTAYLALLSVGLWVLLAPREIPRRVIRAAVIVGGAMLMASWVIVPLFADGKWSLLSEYNANTFWADSFGARQVFSWLFTGRLFDAGRFPVVSLLVAVGVGVCISRFRRDERARGLLGVLVVSLVLYSGRPTFGPLLNLLPGSDDLLLHRYIIGVHMAGLLLAGVGAAWLGRILLNQIRGRLPNVKRVAISAVLLALAVGWLSPAWAERARFNGQGARWIEEQRVGDRTDGADLVSLINEVKRRGDGRVYAGLRGNWGQQYKVVQVPAYAYILTHRADAVGFTLRTTALSSDIEARFALYDGNPVLYDVFNVRYVILPTEMTPTIPATLIGSRGRHRLYRVETSGYMEVVDTTAPIRADRTNIGRRVDPFLRSDLPRRKLFPTIAYGGERAATPTTRPGAQPAGPAGTVQRSAAALEDGRAVADVVANRRAVVMLKVSFDPRWRVFVDGVERRPQMIAPSYVAAPVSPGRHHVRFVFQPYPRYPLLLGLGALTLVGLVLVPRTLSRRRARPLE
jgi:hypothetical protein